MSGPHRGAPGSDGDLVIDFRYHLVSIIAVFLALAVGIVLGTAALNGPIQDVLNDNISRLSSDKRALEADVQELRGQVRASDQFALAVGPGLVRGTLTDRRVLLVTTPETPADLTERLTPLISQAGAEVTGTLQLLPALSDPQSGALVQDLVAEVVPAGVELPEGEPVAQATAELAAALVREVDGDGVEPGEAQAVVSAFEEADLVRFSSTEETLEAATLAVVLTGEPPDERDERQEIEQQAVLDLAAQLDRRSDGAVVAGPTGSAGDRGTVRVVREDSAAADVSTVDNVETGTGLVAVVLALREQLTGSVGQYGVGGGAAGALPSPAAP